MYYHKHVLFAILNLSTLTFTTFIYALAPPYCIGPTSTVQLPVNHPSNPPTNNALVFWCSGSLERTAQVPIPPHHTNRVIPHDAVIRYIWHLANEVRLQVLYALLRYGDRNNRGNAVTSILFQELSLRTITRSITQIGISRRTLNVHA